MRQHLAGAVLACFAMAPAAEAHFQELLPSTDTVTEASGRTVTLDLAFTHPMARGPVMEMARPARFGVLGPAGVEDLGGLLAPRTVEGRQAWQATYAVRRPGNYVFFVEPAPYYEPAEGKLIVHYTKVVVDGFGWGEGWDAAVGLPVEIRPLVRPYGLWTGNLFRGIVERDGAPVPFAEIEVEWRNDGSLEPPGDAFVTQVVKADAAGTFAYAMPRAGWWAFAALVEGDRPMRAPDGKEVAVELGAVMWVRAVDMR
jgi:cobalt/nickel transport protein